ncbi:MAG: hypothetical protein EA367_00035 [Leptolyngbya sp. DLM2.Bin15]|nr:MAG: hypothetical protein EA367_00035 [Leptolyngbya sp. DLM2.Bin15]
MVKIRLEELIMVLMLWLMTSAKTVSGVLLSYQMAAEGGLRATLFIHKVLFCLKPKPTKQCSDSDRFSNKLFIQGHDFNPRL